MSLRKRVRILEGQLEARGKVCLDDYKRLMHLLRCFDALCKHLGLGVGLPMPKPEPDPNRIVVRKLKTGKKGKE